jgi:hypothetical protein
MALYTEILSDESEEAGIHQEQLSIAVSVWSWMQAGEKPPTVAAAARAFNTTPAIIRVAVLAHPWMLLSPRQEPDPEQQHIEHDGE